MNMPAAETTASYKETPYQDETYPIVGTPPSEDTFVPLKVDIIETDEAKTDPMFSDFGGAVPHDHDTIWHLPPGVRYVSEEKKKTSQERKELEKKLVQQQIEEARAEAFAQGKQEGIAQSEQMIQERTQEMNAKVGAILQDLTRQMREKLLEIEKDAAKLSVNITEKILPEVVEINPEYIVPIIEEALDLAGPSIIKRVRVSPADMEFINVVGLQKELEGYDGTWEFASDDTIRAGCVIETSAGQIEYDLDKAWARMKDNIIKVMR